MSDPVTTDATIWGTIGAAVAAAITGAAGWFAGRKKRNASDEAEIARVNVDRVEAVAESNIYTRMIERITRLEDNVRTLNQELDAERRNRRHVENHVSILERLMRQSGINFPELQPLDKG